MANCTHAPEAAAARKGQQHFGLGVREAEQLEHAAARLIADAMSCERQVAWGIGGGMSWRSLSHRLSHTRGAPQAVAALLPDDFRADLRGLVVKVLQVGEPPPAPRACRCPLLTLSPPRSIGTRSGAPGVSRARASRRSPGWSAPAGRRALPAHHINHACSLEAGLSRAQAYRKPAEGGAQPAQSIS